MLDTRARHTAPAIECSCDETLSIMPLVLPLGEQVQQPDLISDHGWNAADELRDRDDTSGPSERPPLKFIAATTAIVASCHMREWKGIGTAKGLLAGPIVRSLPSLQGVSSDFAKDDKTTLNWSYQGTASLPSPSGHTTSLTRSALALRSLDRACASLQRLRRRRDDPRTDQSKVLSAGRSLLSHRGARPAAGHDVERRALDRLWRDPRKVPR